VNTIGTATDGNTIITVDDVIVLDEKIGTTRSKAISVEGESLREITFSLSSTL
jgi:hypothetical protein